MASFKSSNPLLDRFWEMGVRTHLSNMHSILEDCPHREKCQWGGDLHGSWAVGFHALDSAEFYRQQVRLYYTGPMAKGGIPGLVGVGKRLATLQLDFNWGVSPLFLTWRLWTQHGDLETAREFHPQMRHYLSYFSDKDPSGFPNLHQYVDHAAPEEEIPRFPQDKPLISAINYFAAAERFAQLSDALGKPKDAEWARSLAKKIRTAVMTRFDTNQNTWGNGTHDSLALAMGILRDDPATEEKVAAAMVGHYRKNGHKFDGGFMTYWLYPMLSRHGYADDALKMLVNPDYPGPAWSVKNWDATTFWEKFFTDVPTQFERSLSHHATNHPAGWLLTDLAGIRIDMDQPGGKHFLLAPHFPKGLEYASGSMQVADGQELKSSWQRDGEAIIWNVTIPASGVVRADHGERYSTQPALPKALTPGTYQWRLTPKTS
jgi:alpha-L-rhamnosidase